MKKWFLLGFILVVTLFFPSVIYASPVEGINTWIEHQLSSGSSTVSSYFFLFLGGVLASLLPCTYPLYPITINILKSRSGSNNKLLHPVTYYIGIASMYFLFGIIASITGGAFNTVLHLPITNLIIAGVIFLLGLSSMDLLYLPMFSGSSANTNNKTLVWTFLMGMSAGLLSSACVGPVVVSILIGIASASAKFSIGLAFNAASKMLLFGIGVGLPFLLIGVFGLKLPKSGKWMKYIQLALGGLILYFSYIYLEKALLGYGFTDTAIQLMGIGIPTVLFAVYHFQSADMYSYEKTKRALLVLSGIIGCLVLFKAFIPSLPGNSILSSPVPTASLSTEPRTEQKGQLTWYLDKDAAYAAAKEKGKSVFIDFHADWCTNCKEFQKITQSDTLLNAALKNAILLKVYDGTPTFNKYAADTLFPELKVGLPFFLITDKDANLLYKTNDYMKSDEMSMFLSN